MNCSLARRSRAALGSTALSVLLLGAYGVAAGIAADAAHAAAQSEAPANGPRLSIPDTTLFHDHVRGGTVEKFELTVTNTGNKNLEIQDVEPTCHCTVTSFDHIIAPGKLGKITASVDLPPLSAGSISKTIIIYSNDPVNPTETVFLVSKVSPLVGILPTEVDRVEYDDNRPIHRIFTITSQLTKPIELGAPATTGPVQVKIERDPKATNLFHLDVTLTPPPTGGDATGIITIPTSVPNIPPLRISVYGLGNRGITYSPEIVDFGTIYPDSGTLKASVAVFSRKSTFFMRDVRSSDPLVRVNYERLNSAMSWYNLVASVQPGWTKGIHKGTITIETNLPGAERFEIPFTADVQ